MCSFIVNKLRATDSSISPGLINKEDSIYISARGVLPNMGYIGMCDPKGYGFSAVLVINRVSISDFGHFK